MLSEQGDANPGLDYDMKISERLRAAQRELTPAQKNTIRALENKLDYAEEALKNAQSALKMWQKGERYTPRKDDIETEGRNLRQLGTAIASLAGKL